MWIHWIPKMFYVLIINTLLVAATVMLHYEFLHRYLPKMKIKHSYRIVFGVFGAITAHICEIWIFAFAYYVMNRVDGWGSITGNYNGGLLDSAYFSFTVYTTVGFGDIEPLGALRFLTGIESLTGLVLITWTASFLYFEMQRHWKIV